MIQQWTDPFGYAMLRVADPDDDAVADGTRLDTFLSEATPL